MFWAVVSWGIRPACSNVYRLPRADTAPAWCIVARAALLARPTHRPGEQVRVAVCGSVHRRAGEDADGGCGDEDRPADQDQQAEGGVGGGAGHSPDVVQPGAGVVEHTVAQ
jgi:hypothetical protein